MFISILYTPEKVATLQGGVAKVLADETLRRTKLFIRLDFYSYVKNMRDRINLNLTFSVGLRKIVWILILLLFLKKGRTQIGLKSIIFNPPMSSSFEMSNGRPLITIFRGFSFANGKE